MTVPPARSRRLNSGTPGLPPRRAAGAALRLLPLALAGAACVGHGREPSTFQQVQVSALPADGARVLGILTVGEGNLLVTGHDRDSLTVSYAVSAASRAAAFTNPVETIDKADSLFVTMPRDFSGRIDLHVEMPEEMAVALRDEGRRVRFRNVENRVDVFTHSGGALDFDDIEGPLTVQDGPGPIAIHDVRGPIAIQDQGGGITIREVQNSVRIVTRGGDVRIEGVGGGVDVEAGSGRLTIRGVKGDVSYRKTGTGEVSVEDVRGEVRRR